MSDLSSFTNTIDEMGDDTFCVKLIQGELTTIVDYYTTKLEQYALAHMKLLEKVTFFMSASTGNQVFTGCSNLRVADFHRLNNIAYQTFQNCNNLKAVVLRSTWVCTLNYTAVPDAPFFYVPSVLIEEYKKATNWSAIDGSRFRALEEYTVDGTIYGELDESKI